MLDFDLEVGVDGFSVVPGVFPDFGGVEEVFSADCPTAFLVHRLVVDVVH